MGEMGELEHGSFSKIVIETFSPIRIIKLGLIFESLKLALESVTLPMRVTMLAGKNMLMNTAWYIPNISLWPPIQMTWRKTHNYSPMEGT